jgi:formylglycine-generating enzyme required for sulfatase activity
LTQRRPPAFCGFIAAIAVLGALALVGCTRGADGTLGSTFKDCADGCPEMVVIPSGSFDMGAANGEDDRARTSDFARSFTAPRHHVAIGHPFALGKYDVTRAEFAMFVRETGYRLDSDCRGFKYETSLDWQAPGYPQTDRDPVVCVTWKDAQAYVDWLGRKTHQRYRLPTEAEWEYAARAGTSTARYWGDGAAEACRYANIGDITYLQARLMTPTPDQDFACSDGYAYTSPVGSFLPNGYGLYDMLGNVAQLTQDCWHFSYDGAPSDGSAWLDDYCVPRVTRGGSFLHNARGARAAERENVPDFIPTNEIGFRVARDL